MASPDSASLAVQKESAAARTLQQHFDGTASDGLLQIWICNIEPRNRQQQKQRRNTGVLRCAQNDKHFRTSTYL
jgi:hypothetical protein